MIKFGQRYFLDSNIFLYAISEDSSVKKECVSVLDQLADKNCIVVANVAILEEIHFIYFRQTKNQKKCISLLQDIRKGLGYLYPMTDETVKIAWRLFNKQKTPLVSVKDYYHAASMVENSIKTIISYDKDFDQVMEINRLDPGCL